MEYPPPRPLPLPPPKSASRRPLQRRPDSLSNVPAASTIRIVADSGPQAYAKSPFPTLPSQILSPRYAPGPLFESKQGNRVSPTEHPSNVSTDESAAPRPVRQGKPLRTSTSTTSSDVETLANSLSVSSSSRYSHSTLSRQSTVSTPIRRSIDEPKLPILPEERQPEWETPQPQSQSRPQPETEEANDSTIRIVTPSTGGSKASKASPLVSKPSDASLSTTSTDTDASGLRRTRSSSSRNWDTFPRSKQPDDTPSTGSLRAKRASKRPILFESTESLATNASYSSGVDRPRSSSSPISPSHIAAVRSVRFQYPVVRQSFPSSSWAEVSDDQTPKRATSKKALPMNDVDFIPHRYSSRLSTIPSESERTSFSRDVSEQRTSSQLPRRRQTIGSVSTDFTSSNESVPIPQPLFGRGREVAFPQGRESEEGDDTLGELQSPPLRQQRSGYFSRIRPGSSESLRSQSSQISFVGDLSWAKNYYRRGESWVMSPEMRLNTATSANTGFSGRTQSPMSDSFPVYIHRPRTRLRPGEPRPPTADSVGIASERTTSLGRMPSFNAGVWSPHLVRDRRSGAGLYGLWRAPSLDEPLGELLFGPVNRQILLFCFGFMVPLAWILAAMLPIPEQPDELPFGDAFNRASTTEGPYGPVHLPNTSLMDLVEMNDRRHQKAKWWRTLNRIMILPGLMIIAAVTALAVVASRLH